MSLPGVTSNGGVTPHTTSQKLHVACENAPTCKKTAKIRSKEEGGWVCKCCQGQTPQNFDRVLAAACLFRDMLSCQTHLSESAMMAQHSDVGRRRRLQKPYHPLRACACPWKLQDSTLDHLVVASLIIGGGSHPAPARLARRGYAWDPHHTGTTPTKATRLGCPHTPRQTSVRRRTTV